MQYFEANLWFTVNKMTLFATETDLKNIVQYAYTVLQGSGSMLLWSDTVLLTKRKENLRETFGVSLNQPCEN